MTASASSPPHAFVLGVSGSGKSMGMKGTIANVAMGNDDDIIIIGRRSGEYGPIARALGGEIIEISPSSRHHINPLDLGDCYGDGDDPIAMKSQLLMSIIEQQMGAGSLDGGHRSIIDRCTGNILRPCLKRGYQEPSAAPHRLAAGGHGTDRGQGTGACPGYRAHRGRDPQRVRSPHQCGHEQQDRLSWTCTRWGSSSAPPPWWWPWRPSRTGLWRTGKRGKYTWVFVDEARTCFFKYVFSAQFLYKAWKRFRKYAGIMTAATQNVEECLRSETARLMFANSEFLVLYNQAATDRAELARLLRISDTQMGLYHQLAPGHRPDPHGRRHRPLRQHHPQGYPALPPHVHHPGGRGGELTVSQVGTD